MFRITQVEWLVNYLVIYTLWVYINQLNDYLGAGSILISQWPMLVLEWYAHTWWIYLCFLGQCCHGEFCGLWLNKRKVFGTVLIYLQAASMASKDIGYQLFSILSIIFLIYNPYMIYLFLHLKKNLSLLLFSWIRKMKT